MSKIIAHRGFSGNYPENTMLAFEKAIEAGAEGIEMDVHLTKDGVPVIIHDEKVDRTTDGTGFVRDMTLEQLRAIDASYRFKGMYGTNPIPTLREYLDFASKHDFITNIELKTSIYEYPGIEKKVIDMLREYKIEERIILSSFNHFTILRCKESMNDRRHIELIISKLVLIDVFFGLPYIIVILR